MADFLKIRNYFGTVQNNMSIIVLTSDLMAEINKSLEPVTRHLVRR
jgi:hypothetical protein